MTIFYEKSFYRPCKCCGAMVGEVDDFGWEIVESKDRDFEVLCKYCVEEVRDADTP